MLANFIFRCHCTPLGGIMCKSNFCRWSSILLIVLTSSLLINPALAEPIQGPYVPGEVIIKYADTATSGDINTLSSQLNFIRLREFSRIGASLERLTIGEVEGGRT